MLEAEIEELLRELMSASHAQSVHIAEESEPVPEGGCRARLGDGAELRAFFQSDEQAPALQSRQELLERSARALRACRKRHRAHSWPTVSLPGETRDPRGLILARMREFLQGLVATSKLYQMVLMCRGQLISSAEPLEELDRERLQLLERQLARAAQQTQGSDHGELIQDGVYARSFWYGAALIGFARHGYSLDLVRHRSKMVARELAQLLAMYDDDPTSPVKVAPPPEE